MKRLFYLFVLIALSLPIHAQSVKTVRVIDEMRTTWSPLFESERSGLIIQHIELSQDGVVDHVLSIEVSNVEFVQTGMSTSVFGYGGRFGVSGGSSYARNAQEGQEIIAQDRAAYLVSALTALFSRGESMPANEYYQIAVIDLTPNVSLSYDKSLFYLTINGVTARLPIEKVNDLYRVLKSLRDV